MRKIATRTTILKSTKARRLRATSHKIMSSRSAYNASVKTKRQLANPAPSGYRESPSGLIVPDAKSEPVSPTKFAKGLKSAKFAIKETISGFTDFMTQDMVISEIEFSVSFSAKGEFLGFGIGGDASVKIKICPLKQAD